MFPMSIVHATKKVAGPVTSTCALGDEALWKEHAPAIRSFYRDESRCRCMIFLAPSIIGCPLVEQRHSIAHLRKEDSRHSHSSVVDCMGGSGNRKERAAQSWGAVEEGIVVVKVTRGCFDLLHEVDLPFMLVSRYTRTPDGLRLHPVPVDISSWCK